MSQEKRLASVELAATIKRIRVRLGMNMTKFAKAIGVTQGQVSRYEAGLATPGPSTLADLVRLADGAEKNPMLKCLTEMLQPGLQRGPMSEGEALSEVAAQRKRFDAMWAAEMELQAAGTPRPFWANILGIAPNLAKLLQLVSGLYESKREVDASLVRILQLWCGNHRDSDPAVRQCFAEAAQYLEFLLRTKTAQDVGGPVFDYSVILPVDFGDGKLHARGEILRLDFETARRHSDALRRVEEAEPASEQKLA